MFPPFSLATFAIPAVTVLAASIDQIPLELRLSSQARRTFEVSDFFRGKDLLDWNFFDDSDPTHGTVNYQSREAAMSKGLARLDSTGALVLTVDSWSHLEPGEYRDSVRIVSPDTYTGGLFIADFAAMPFGPTTWPSWWSTGPNWPHSGEIDVVEGVNDLNYNQHTLHTSAGCFLDTSHSSKYSGRARNLDCKSGSGTNNAGCQVIDKDTKSYGKGFNEVGGGVFAHLWDNSGIKIWHFARSKIPGDITRMEPDPSTWGRPVAFFSSATCDAKKFFREHVLVINTSICGDWAGNAYPGGMSACKKATANPKNYLNAKWKINYVAVYD